MGKRRGIELKAEAPEDGLLLRRGERGLVLQIDGLLVARAPEARITTTGERAFVSARQARAFARTIERLVDSLVGGRSGDRRRCSEECDRLPGHEGPHAVEIAP